MDTAQNPNQSLHNNSDGFAAEDYDALEAIEFSPVESDQELKEELAALEDLGAWNVSDYAEISLVDAADTTTEDPAAVLEFPITRNKQVDFYIDQFQNKQRRHFKRWLARSAKYKPYISKELDKAGLPQDLLYLAMIESGFNPSAYSHAHAAGLWQFIRSTGRNFGLRIDSYVDERRNPEKATRAAAAYLGELYERFGDWQLAVAAYNAGEGKIERGLKKYKCETFWELADHKYLALETKRYVPKLIAAIIVARDPAAYGFTDIKYKTAEQYDEIEVPSRTNLQAVALSGKTSVKKLRELNNELRKNQAPPKRGTYTLRIPKGSHDQIAANLPRAHTIVTTKYKTHKVRKNDTFAGISRKYHISMTTLLKANKLDSSGLKSGQRLRIPYRSTKYVLLKKGQSASDYYAANSGRMILHELGQGETLSRVSKKYNVPVSLLVEWNDIKNVRRIRAGHQLAIYVDQGGEAFQVASAPKAKAEKVIVLTATGKSRVTKAKETSVPAVADSRKSEPASQNSVADLAGNEIEGAVISLSDNKKRKPANTTEQGISYYKVRNGDSLWSIARRYRVSTRDIMRWNHLPNNKLQPGTRLVIKKS